MLPYGKGSDSVREVEKQSDNWKLHRCFSAPKFVVRVLIRFVKVAKLIVPRNYYLFSHELLDSIPFQKSLMAFVYLEQF